MDKKLLTFNFKYLLLFTLLPINSRKSSYLQVVLFYCLRCFFILILFCVWLPFLYELYLGKRSAFIDYSLTVVNTGAYLCNILSLLFYTKNGYDGRKLIKELNLSFKRKADYDEADMESMDKYCTKMALILTTLLNIGALSMALLPMVLGGRKLPAPGEYPGFNPVNNTVHYIELYIVQGIGQTLLSNVTGSSDSFLICMVLMCSQQVKIMAKDFHNCLYNALINYGVDKKEVLKFKESVEGLKETQNLSDLKSANNYILDIISTCEFKKYLNELMISYIKHHQYILLFFNKMQHFFLPITFIKVCISMFYHVFVTFACLSITERTISLILAEYEVCAIAELLIFALAGQALINESENLYKDLITSPWYICDIKFQKNFYMVLIRSGRISQISVGKLTNLSLPTFLLIMKTALSYLAVLRQVVE